MTTTRKQAQVMLEGHSRMISTGVLSPENPWSDAKRAGAAMKRLIQKGTEDYLRRLESANDSPPDRPKPKHLEQEKSAGEARVPKPSHPWRTDVVTKKPPKKSKAVR